MNALVTGHAGYVGGELAAQLSEAGHDVVGFDRQADAEDDVRDAERVRSLFETHEFDVVYNLAADADVWADEWRYLVENNVMGTVNVVENARSRGIPVVHASSVAASGEFNPYGRSKRLAEAAVDPYEGVTTVRFPNVIGGDPPRGQADAMVQQGIDGEIEAWERGEIRRSYVDVSDLGEFLRELGAGSFDVETPSSVFAHTATNEALGELIQEAVEAETGDRPALSLVDRSPPSPLSLTAEDLRLRDPTPLSTSLRAQVRNALGE
jgi:nucleoside-diphosphate-sugar epimerase